jgi:hypothetical protein
LKSNQDRSRQSIQLTRITPNAWHNAYFDYKTIHELQEPTNTPNIAPTDLTVTPQGEGVVLLPGLSAATIGLGVSVTLVDTTRLLAGCGKTTSFAVL